MGFRHVYPHDPLPLFPTLSFLLQITTCPATPRALCTATWSPFAVGLPHGRSLYSVTLRGRPFSWSAPSLGHPLWLALLMVGPSTRPPFALVTLLGQPSPCRSLTILIFFIISFVGLKLHLGIGDY
ncbi:hypothetical protein CsSME_00013991 [Camellia sinensis var. sinensis]